MEINNFITLHIGDCIDEMKKFKSESIDLIVNIINKELNI